MLLSCFDYIFVYLRQKARLRRELSPKSLSTLGSNPARTRPEKPGPTYNSELSGKYTKYHKVSQATRGQHWVWGKNDSEFRFWKVKIFLDLCQLVVDVTVIVASLL